jgi:putative transposase
MGYVHSGKVQAPKGRDNGSAMPQSLAQVLVHLVFSTKHRAAWLQDKQLRGDLHAYLATVLQNIDCPPIIFGGVADHVHILCCLSRKLTIANVVEEVKTEPSKWMKKQGPQYADFYWQNGYGVFSVSSSNRERVTNYIRNQEEHHQRMTYQDEFRMLCKKHGLIWDERYVWD